MKLSVSNHMYLSGFGGGFKQHIVLYEGLIYELKDEVPMWSDYLLDKLDTTNPLILTIEQTANSYMKNKPIPLHIIIFIHVSGEELQSKPFIVTKEVRALLDMNINDFHKAVDHTPGIASTGIRDYHLIRSKLNQNELYNEITTAHFKMDKPTITLSKSDMGYDKVMVELSKGYRRPYREIIKNNKNFNRNLDRAWRPREAYGKMILSQTGSELVSSRRSLNKTQKTQKANRVNASMSNNGFEEVRKKISKNKNTNKRQHKRK